MECNGIIELEGREVPFIIIRSENAQNYRLEVGIDRELRIIAPEGGNKDIEALVSEKKDWVLEKLNK
ncbi:hypothetical protein AKJ45_02850 [candidate division MSBL1 archaeon SCGC-AAA261F19]|uniref:Uncharacterized protein n=2 Tax=candidate division MSBL1 TaxID=215777 RepID=A0A133V9C7_9EURY|nr:hypothetical protein AKJ43_03130 [candidate division MSBL1 archaeon SCGC-AAA261D19]KXB02997.1 hypothetical protein AKJ45_02850 [candidate division MSBL1 archaeon SCGC-AAA261F19]